MADSSANHGENVLPEQVIQYLLNFYGKFIDSDSTALHGLYESGFTRLAERYYKNSPLPATSVVRKLITDSIASAQDGLAPQETVATTPISQRASNDLNLFILLYQELGYRHVHTRLHPTLVQRAESWQNYLAIFDHIIRGHFRDTALPPSWLWDLIDEFLYQFEEYHQYRARGHENRLENAAETAESDATWNIRTTLEVLHALVEKTGIVEWLHGSRNSAKPEQDLSTQLMDTVVARQLAAASGSSLATKPLPPAATETSENADGMDSAIDEDHDENDDDHDDDGESFAGADEDTSTSAQAQPPAAHSPIHRYLGYFAMIGLLRVHCATGDFYMALAALEPASLFEIESVGGFANTVSSQSARNAPPSADLAVMGSSVTSSADLSARLHSHVTACHVALYYYIGFTALMLRRYEDAIRALQPAILHITRTRHIHTRSFQYDQVNKRIDQMLALLALAQCLGQNRLDDSMNNWLREKLGDRVTRMRQGDWNAFEELYNHACPKFVSPAVAMTCREEFLRHVAQVESGLPAQLSSYLRIYRTIDVQKLAEYLELGDDASQGAEQVLAALLCLKYRALLKQRAATAVFSVSPRSMPVGDSEFASTSDMEFLVDDMGMVDVLETRTGKRPEEYFLRNIPRLGEQVGLYRRVQRERLQATAAAFAQKEQARLEREKQQRKAREEAERLESLRAAQAQQAAEANAMLAARPRSLAERLSSVERSQ
jgi:hypothetical protein